MPGNGALFLRPPEHPMRGGAGFSNGALFIYRLYIPFYLSSPVITTATATQRKNILTPPIMGILWNSVPPTCSEERRQLEPGLAFWRKFDSAKAAHVLFWCLCDYFATVCRLYGPSLFLNSELRQVSARKAQRAGLYLYP